MGVLGIRSQPRIVDQLLLFSQMLNWSQVSLFGSYAVHRLRLPQIGGSTDATRNVHGKLKEFVLRLMLRRGQRAQNYIPTDEQVARNVHQFKCRTNSGAVL